MKVILINEEIYVLNDNIVSIVKEWIIHEKIKYHTIKFTYTNGKTKKEYFQDEEERDAIFNEIYTIMKEVD